MISNKWIAWTVAGVVAVAVPALALGKPSRHTAAAAVQPDLAQSGTQHLHRAGTVAASRHQLHTARHSSARAATRKPHSAKHKHKSAATRASHKAHASRAARL